MPLSERQNKRIGRIAEKNPERAERVAERMSKRENRAEVGKKIAEKYSPAVQEKVTKQVELLTRKPSRPDIPLATSPSEGTRATVTEMIRQAKPMPNPAYDKKIESNMKKIRMQEAKDKINSSYRKDI